MRLRPIHLALAIAGVIAPGQDVRADGFRFGQAERSILLDHAPGGVAIDEAGIIFITEAPTGRVHTYQRDGTHLATWGERGDGVHQLLWPGDVEVRGAEVFICDTGHGRIAVFDRTGRFLRAIGDAGRDADQLNQPRGLAVAADRVAVADTGNRRVLVFDASGRVLFALDALLTPADVSFDPAGNLYVSDADANRLSSFDPTGEARVSWGDWGPFPGLFDQPRAVFWHGEEVWVVDERNHRVQAFAAEGDLSYQWGQHELIAHEANGRLHYPTAAAIASDGSFAVIAEPIENRVQIIARVQPEDVPDSPPLDPPTRTHFGMHIDIDGHLLVVPEPENHSVYLMDAREEIPVIINQFGERGTHFGLIAHTNGVAADLEGRRVWVSDRVTARIQEFRLDYDPSGPLRYQPYMTVMARALSTSVLAAQAEMADASDEFVLTDRDAEGNFLVLDRRRDTVLLFDPEWQLVSEWGGRGDATGLLRAPTDGAFSADGASIYIVDSQNARVQVFDRAGGLQRTFGTWGRANGRFVEPFGIAVGADGFLYVTDAERDRVLKFDAEGSFITEWGRHGDNPDQLWKPRGIVQDQSGRLIVIDHGNHRAQIYDTDGVWLAMFSTGRSVTRAQYLAGD